MTSITERHFRCSPTARKAAFGICTGCLAVVTSTVLLTTSSLIDKVSALSLATTLAIVGILLVVTKQAILSDTSLTLRTAFSQTALRWIDVEDLLESQRRICLKGKGRRICLSHSEYGLSLEPFEELRDAILRRVDEPLRRKWANISLDERRCYACRGLGISHTIAYAIPLFLIVSVFIAFPVWKGIFGWEAFLFLAGSISVLTIFWARDHRRSSKILVLSAQGVGEQNGKAQSLPWNDIEQLVVKDGIMGDGCLTIVGRQGQITVPRTIERCGELLYLLESNSRAARVDTFEY